MTPEEEQEEKEPEKTCVDYMAIARAVAKAVAEGWQGGKIKEARAGK